MRGTCNPRAARFLNDTGKRSYCQSKHSSGSTG